MQSPGGVDDHHVVPARRGGLDRVESDGGRVSPLFAADEVGTRPIGPDLELFLGGGAVGIGRGD